MNKYIILLFVTVSCVSAQFSAWDGSHIELVNAVKQDLLDKKSFQHIQTNHESNLVAMKFKAKNSFGGYVEKIVVAKLDRKGNLITWNYLE